MNAMDIDDILANVDAPSIPEPAHDLRALTRIWMTERAAPELLPWPASLVDRVVARMTEQTDEIERRTAEAAESQGLSGAGGAGFSLVILQTEMERCKFLVRSLLRSRLAKVRKWARDVSSKSDHALQIDSHPLYYSTGEPSTRLSKSENQYLNAHQTLMSSHYAASFLAQFPVQLRKLDDTSGGASMVEIPDVERAVFVRVLRDAGMVGTPGDRARADLKRGDVWVLRWSVIKDLVEMGDVELI